MLSAGMSLGAGLKKLAISEATLSLRRQEPDEKKREVAKRLKRLEDGKADWKDWQPINTAISRCSGKLPVETDDTWLPPPADNDVLCPCDAHASSPPAVADREEVLSWKLRSAVMARITGLRTARARIDWDLAAGRVRGQSNDSLVIQAGEGTRVGLAYPAPREFRG